MTLFSRTTPPPEPAPDNTKTWTLYAEDPPTVRARKLAEIALYSVLHNPARLGMIEPAAFGIAQALERYELLDREVAASQPVTNPALAAPKEGRDG